MIHETAIIDPRATIGKDVSIGPWTWIGPDVVIGDHCDIRSHVVIKGPTTLGKNNLIYQFSSIGEDCQDKKYAGEPTRLVIGDDNVFRESCTVHRGTVQDQGITSIGSRNLFMAYVHVAHDCMIGDDNIFANNSTLAGHVHVGNFVILGGFTGVHQFCKIGSHAFAAMKSGIAKDVPPFVMVEGFQSIPRSINREGLKRRGFSAEDIQIIFQAYKLLYRRQLTVDEAVAEMQQLNSPHVDAMVEFIQQSTRGLVR